MAFIHVQACCNYKHSGDLATVVSAVLVITASITLTAKFQMTDIGQFYHPHYSTVLVFSNMYNDGMVESHLFTSSTILYPTVL